MQPESSGAQASFLQIMDLLLDLSWKLPGLKHVSALCREAFRRFHIFTVPLSPTRASFLLGGRNKHMGYEAYQVQQRAHASRCMMRAALMWFLRADLAAEVSCLTPELWLMQAVVDLRNHPHPCEYAFLGQHIGAYCSTRSVCIIIKKALSSNQSLRQSACGVQIDLQAYRDCPVPDERLFLEICNINVKSTRFPIPVQPLTDKPELVRVVDAIENEFEWLRKRYRGTIVLG